MTMLRTTLFAASAAVVFASLGAGSAFATGWDIFGNNNGSNAQPVFAAQHMEMHAARAESCTFDKPIYDAAGKIVEHQMVDICAR